MIIPLSIPVDITWHSVRASFYSNCCVNLTVHCTNASSPVMMVGIPLRSLSRTCCRPAVNYLHQRSTICLLMTLAPYTWHSWRWISIGAMLCAFINFITDPTSQPAGARIRSLHLQPLQRCYCEDSGSPTNLCVMRYHSLNKWFAIILVMTLSSRGRGFTSSENRTNHSCSYNVAEYKSHCSSLLVRELKYYVRPKKML